MQTSTAETELQGNRPEITEHQPRGPMHPSTRQLTGVATVADNATNCAEGGQ